MQMALMNIPNTTNYITTHLKAFSRFNAVISFLAMSSNSSAHRRNSVKWEVMEACRDCTFGSDSDRVYVCDAASELVEDVGGVAVDVEDFADVRETNSLTSACSCDTSLSDVLYATFMRG